MVSKKLERLSFILVLSLILSIFAPFKALAAGNGVVTLDNPRAGVEYNLFRVFDLSYDSEVGAYTYTSVTEGLENAIKAKYSSLLKKNTDGSDVKRGDRIVIDSENLTNPQAEDYVNPYDFSKWLYSLDENLLVKEGNTQTGVEGTNLQWTGLNLGYYMIKSNAGTIVSLDTTDTEATVHEKNPNEDMLNMTKTVKGGTAEDFAESTYANIGETVTFKITFDVHQYANNEYVLTDELPAGMDYVGNFSVDGVEANKYTVDTPLSDTSRNLQISFPVKTIQEIAEALRTGAETAKTITITYDAKLNNSAAMSDSGAVNSNKNKAELKYDTADTAKVSKDASVKTTEFDIYKFAKKENNEEKALAGAKFKIYTAETGGELIKFTKGDGEVYFVDPNGSVEEITTDASGKFTIKGLKTGDYYIEETEAPEGFNLLDKRVKVGISERQDGQKVLYNEQENKEIKIENQAGGKLPDTGGMGRTLIYTIGGIIFFGALILLVSRNKNKNKEA